MNRIFNLSRRNRLTVFQEFLPVTLISQALGVFPLKIKNVSGNQVFVTSRGATIYSIVLVGLSFVHLIYLPQMTIASSNFVNGYNNSTNNTVKNLQSPLTSPHLLIRFLNGIVMGLMGISSKVNAISYVRSNLPKAFANLNLIDGLLGPKLKHHQSNVNTIWILVGFSILVGLPGQIYSSIFIYFSESYFIGIYVFGNMMNNFTAVFAEAQFLALCYILKSRFDIINRKLLDLLNFYDLEKRQFRTSPNELRIVSIHAAGILSYSDIKRITALRKGLTTQKKNRPATNVPNSYSKISISETIQTLRLGHQRLCDVLDQVNHMFQVLFSISGCFLNELFNMYSLLSGGAWKGKKSTNLNASNNANIMLLSHPLINLSWAIYYATRIIAMAIIASKTTNMAKHSLIHILDVRQSSLDFATKEELRFFHDHVTSRKVAFSAAGFFNLDIALISSIVATGSTYLVVMVQFHE